ncbi:MAG: hypothetical protein IJE23_03305 [Tyzzerella sp.]|nr:hypothetical protein [Tyzzerella sp.]
METMKLLIWTKFVRAILLSYVYRYTSDFHDVSVKKKFNLMKTENGE